jgi:cell division protease FtsH
MVMRFGMSDKLGPRVFGHDHGLPFLGREFSSEPDYSDEIAREIDDEIRRIVEEAHQLARDILEQHRPQLELTSEILLRRETIEREQFIDLLDGKTEQEVFGQEQPALPPPPPAPEAPERKPERAPKPLPRPGLAGGTADMRGAPPEKPQPA